MAHRVDDLDLSQRISEEESSRRIARAQRRLVQLRLFTAGLLTPQELGPGVVVLFEGFDAAGKGGAIRRLTSGLDPRHVRVVPVGPPSPEESRHHFLWRFQPAMPGRGDLTVYDRSWYGRVLVERVEELISPPTVEQSLTEIVEFERGLVNNGTTVIKLWLHVSDGEQLRRFQAREKDPLKRWKLTPEDWRNREQRPKYLAALRDLVDATDQPHAHWDLISGEDKHLARATVLETVTRRWAHDLERRGLRVPEARDEEYLW